MSIDLSFYGVDEYVTFVFDFNFQVEETANGDLHFPDLQASLQSFDLSTMRRSYREDTSQRRYAHSEINESRLFSVLRQMKVVPIVATLVTTLHQLFQIVLL